MAVGGEEATGIANQLVREADSLAALEAEQQTTTQAGRRAKASRGRADRLPTTGDYLKGIGFALAIGGAVKDSSGRRVPLKSCIGFVNTINRSLAMTRVLQSESVREWVAKQAGEPVPNYRLEHLDASSPVATRDEAKRRLAAGDEQAPHCVLNVGIFGEGTDSPSLSAVAFLEPRKSPIDVVQAVGRAMRRAKGKSLGYIVVPIVIPPGVDAEEHLAVSDKHEGWRELGDILQALRAHDKRIEDALPEMLSVQLPPDPPLELELQTVVAVGRPDKTRLEYAVINGSRERAIETAQAAVKQQRPLLDFEDTEPFDEETLQRVQYEPDSVIVHVERPDGSFETRQDSVVHHKPERNEDRGRVNAPQTKRRAVEHGAKPDGVAALQKLAVEEVIKGLDINAVSLQLAATQLMSGNTDTTYRKMGLHLMPYGRQSDGSVSAGTPELFARSEIVDANRLFDDAAESSTILTGAERQRRSGGPEMDDATAAVRDARIIIMNPPFTNRTKMGEKWAFANSWGGGG